MPQLKEAMPERGACSVRRWLALGLLSVGLLSYRMSSMAQPPLPLRPLLRSPRATPPTYMLVRTIGNALPPRHEPARALQNLRFILEHERLDDEQVATHWVLNRLADERVARQFREVLAEFDAPFTELPLRLAQYAEAPFNVVVEDHGVDRVHEEPGDEDEWTQNLDVNAVYASKNRHALGINGARNVMLDIARESGARWLLPWVQTCFLTHEAWGQIKRDLDNAAPDQKYFMSFMDRLTEEDDVILSPDFKVDPWEEPQIIFRNDSVERFDEQLRYGQRDKAALLIRLQVNGVWNGWGWSSWEQQRTYANLSKDVSGPDAVPSTGYVIRLYSGLESEMEQNTALAGYGREIRRAKGVISMLDKLEERVMLELYRYRPDKLLVYDEALLQQYTENSNTEEGKQAISGLLDDASRAMEISEPWTVTSNKALDPGHDPRVFANYFDQKEGPLDDGDFIREMAYNTTALSLAWRVTGDKQYAVQASRFLEAWCADSTSAMRATLEYADMSYQKLLTSTDGNTRGSLMGIRHTAVIPMLLDAIRLLNATSSNASEDGAFQGDLSDKVVQWTRDLFDGLQSEYARDTFRWSSGLFASLYDVQVAALGAFLNDSKSLRFTLGTMQGRLMTMMSSEEKLLVPTGVATKPYTMLTLATWGFAVDLAQQFGLSRHLFQFDLTRNRREERVNEEGGLLCRFVGHSVPCCQTEASSGTSGHQCVRALQHADEAQLFVYSRIVRQAVEHCPILQKRPSCASLAHIEPDSKGLSAHEMSRYLLPPYPLLRATKG
ncbi:hypothetical protein PF008_g20049 [Phytophthora fragariae]|uniref:Alginate lyase domain-containing protein n=1 Tax=Phytophthora fragariae TaxID=53985 RepID=A0A6G0R0L7_9STRA|nr:hypothetical protein PF008_g20049 [Phytophthora fragariae]